MCVFLFFFPPAFCFKIIYLLLSFRLIGSMLAFAKAYHFCNCFTIFVPESTLFLISHCAHCAFFVATVSHLLTHA